MKQGRSSNVREGKVEPKSEAINPGAVNQLGNHPGTARAVEPLHSGRGFSAPMTGSQVHKSGSQGKRK